MWMFIASNGCKTLLTSHLNWWKVGLILCCVHIGVYTFDFEVVSSKAVSLEVEGQGGVGLIQEQVDPRQFNTVPLKHRP